MAGKQAKVLTDKQVDFIRKHLEQGKHGQRDSVMFLLSVKAGLRAAEIADLRWSMVTDAEGFIADAIQLPDSATKGGKGGRTIPMHPRLKVYLADLRENDGAQAGPDTAVIYSTKPGAHGGWTANGAAVWFFNLYKGLGYDGCSSHSGRRTFITNLAKKIGEAGGSIKDVQELAGHASLSTTQAYIQGDAEAKQKVVALI